MPVTPTYPGVYIEEIPSGIRTITGVPTSVTAFVGRTRRGPVDVPVAINSFADFERRFGGLWQDSALSFAIQDFYLNGGSQAIVVRLFNDANGAGLATIDANGFQFEAASAGSWANGLRVRIDQDVLPEAAERLQVPESDVFNLTVRDTATGLTESFPNVTLGDSARQVTRIVEAGSSLVRVATVAGSITPHQDPAAGVDVWSDDNASTQVTAQADDGEELTDGDFVGPGKPSAKQGLYALEATDLFNLLCIPPYKADGVASQVIAEAVSLCERRRAIFLIDPPAQWTDKDTVKANLDAIGSSSKNAAVYFPRLRRPNPLRENLLEDFAPCGAVAGVYSRTDAARGVWKAPAGVDATLNGVTQLSVALNDPENGELNPLGVNALRVQPAVGPVVWGARTREGDDRLASEWKYLSVRRLALFIEESLVRGTHWAVFEPNDEPLWAQLRLNINAFMQNLFRQGAFQGTTPQEAYLVKVDRETTTQDDVNRGVVNILVGFAPLKPAEFVILRIQQLVGQNQQ